MFVPAAAQCEELVQHIRRQGDVSDRHALRVCGGTQHERKGVEREGVRHLDSLGQRDRLFARLQPFGCVQQQCPRTGHPGQRRVGCLKKGHAASQHSEGVIFRHLTTRTRDQPHGVQRGVIRVLVQKLHRDAESPLVDGHIEEQLRITHTGGGYFGRQRLLVRPLHALADLDEVIQRHGGEQSHTRRLRHVPLRQRRGTSRNAGKATVAPASHHALLLRAVLVGQTGHPRDRQPLSRSIGKLEPQRVVAPQKQGISLLHRRCQCGADLRQLCVKAQQLDKGGRGLFIAAFLLQRGRMQVAQPVVTGELRQQRLEETHRTSPVAILAHGVRHFLKGAGICSRAACQLQQQAVARLIIARLDHQPRDFLLRGGGLIERGGRLQRAQRLFRQTAVLLATGDLGQQHEILRPHPRGFVKAASALLIVVHRAVDLRQRHPRRGAATILPLPRLKLLQQRF